MGYCDYRKFIPQLKSSPNVVGITPGIVTRWAPTLAVWGLAAGAGVTLYASDVYVASEVLGVVGIPLTACLTNRLRCILNTYAHGPQSTLRWLYCPSACNIQTKIQKRHPQASASATGILCRQDARQR